MQTIKKNGIEFSIVNGHGNNSSMKNRFVYLYFINIKNTNIFPVQIIKEQWKITSGIGKVKYLTYEGLATRESPSLNQHETYEYGVWFELDAPTGILEGKYVLQDKSNGNLFEAALPSIIAIAPYLLN
ncbi:MAG: ApaG domain [Chitinophagales bacterium]|nr:ApaG domain-containing protein [Chitinophagales bacterium]MDW8273253.1 ApaG domain [Chitinophagales bacterium]